MILVQVYHARPGSGSFRNFLIEIGAGQCLDLTLNPKRVKVRLYIKVIFLFLPL